MRAILFEARASGTGTEEEQRRLAEPSQFRNVRIAKPESGSSVHPDRSIPEVNWVIYLAVRVICALNRSGRVQQCSFRRLERAFFIVLAAMSHQEAN